MSERETFGARVLIADDSEPNREILSEFLQLEGYTVFCAENGEQALARLRSGEVDLGLLDVMMPRLSGFEVCKTLKSSPETRLVPVVLVTGLAQSQDRVRGIECGADDFLSKPVVREELLARVRSLLRLKLFTDELDNAETVLFSLARGIEAKDPYTGGHCERLSKYSVALAKRLGLKDDLCFALRRAGVVHDIGKLAVPEHILLKPGPLTPEEWAVMKQHPVFGERICSPLRSFRQVLPIIRHHHERLDGSGYPDGLKGDQIPLAARVLTTVDIYDALTTERPYRKALSNQEAFETLRREAARGWWDVALLNELEAALAAGEPAAVTAALS